MVAAHQITRGLGFSSSIFNYIDADGNAVMAPEVKSVDGIVSFKPLTGFDSILFADDKGLADVANVLTTMPKSFTSPNEYLKKLNSEPYHNASLDLFTMIAGRDLYAKTKHDIASIFRSSNMDNVMFQVSRDYDHYEEFLMSAESLEKQVTLDEFMSKRGMSALYGPKTLSILNTIGFKIRGINEIGPKFQVSREYGTKDYSPLDTDNGSRLYPSHLDLSSTNSIPRIMDIENMDIDRQYLVDFAAAEMQGTGI